MTRLYIVEQSGWGPGGHYHAYTGCVAAGARELGLEPVILANKRMRTATPAPLPPDIVPCFTHTWAEAELHGKLGWEAGNIAFEMFEGFARVPPAPDDHVFLHTLGFRELQALLACLTEKVPLLPLPYFHILLRRDPDILIENYEHFAEYFVRIAASPRLQQKIRFHTDTQLLSEAFGEVCRVPFLTAPIPFDQSFLLSALAARPPHADGQPLTIAYLGDAREEKGYQHLPQALSFLWKDYIAKGRVRFVLQSNFNAPGGEPGVLAASQILAGFLSTVLKSEPLKPDEYYQILADADIVVIPYSAKRYRYRSSGVLVETMGAGKPVVTSAGSWMATQVTADHAVLFETPADLGPALAATIDRFDRLLAGAQARREDVLEHATGASLVRHLLAAGQPSAAPVRKTRRRILLVMNGDAMVLQNGASRVAHAQMLYLTAAGYDVVGLFLTYNAPANVEEALDQWSAALGRAIAVFPLERVFVAGPGRWGFDPDQSPALRNQRQELGAPLKAEFDFVAGFEFGGKLLQFLRDHPVDAVLLNYITNYPVIRVLGLDGVPVICEMHDLQSFQRAIYGERLVDPEDLVEEFTWLARCAALLSLNPRETAIVRERLPNVIAETTGVFLPTPPSSLSSLAGAKDLAEIVSSSGPVLREYQFEAAWEIGNTASVERLIEIGSVDLLYVSSAHKSNVSGLKWFFSQVYEPYLAQNRVSIVVAGSICRLPGWPRDRRIFLIDQVENLAPLYAAARVVVLPIIAGAGSPVKTYEAFAYGRPIVGTSTAFRGIDAEPGEFIVRDDPKEFAEAILDLLDSPEESRRAASRSRSTAARCNQFAQYFRVMDGVLGAVLGEEVVPTSAPPPQTSGPAVEWSPSLQAVNRVVRSYLDGEPFEGWALDLLVEENPETVDMLLDGVSRSLLDRRDAAVLRTEKRLRHYVAKYLGGHLRDSIEFAVSLALAEWRGVPPGSGDADTRVVVHGGLPLTVAGAVTGVFGAAEREPGEGGVAVVIDGRLLAARRVSDTGRHAGRAMVFRAEIAALDGSNIGLRTVDLDGAEIAHNCGPLVDIAVLRHSVPILPDVRALSRSVFQGGFVVGNGGADLPGGETGRLSLPRIIDGRHVGYIDLCCARLDADAPGSSAAHHTAPQLSVVLDAKPVEIELIGGGTLTVARLLLGPQSAIDDFGVVTLTISNTGGQLLRLVAIHSGLLLGPTAKAAAIAAALARPGDQPNQGNYLLRSAREAIAMLIRGAAPIGPALDALCMFTAGADSEDTLPTLIAPVVSRALQRTDGIPVTAEAVLGDAEAIIGNCNGAGNPTTAIFSPALPFDLVDRAGQVLIQQTAAALRQRGSWRVPMPDPRHEKIRIRLNAMLEIVGHPDLIEFTNFYPVEHQEIPIRWTGPGNTSTITLPLALNNPALLVIELGPLSRNQAMRDFAIGCNGVTIPHTAEVRPQQTTLTAHLPAERRAAPVTKIALTIGQTYQRPPDIRLLGVLFRSLTLYLGDPEQLPMAAPESELAVLDSQAIPGLTRDLTPVPRQSGNAAAAATPVTPIGRRALVLDDSVPEPDKDAGSNAIWQHMLSLQRLGYNVSFIPADNMAKIDPYTNTLEERGIECFYRPHYTSVEDVLRQQPAPFDLVYVHRYANVSQYVDAVRHQSPNARILYSVADLHFLRLQRQAELENDAELYEQAEKLRSNELAAMLRVDCVIVHSSAEAELLKEASPGTEVRVIPWAVEPRSVVKTETDRPRLAFIGGFRHPPNVDAAKWTAHDIMPWLRQQIPNIELLLVGSNMPDEVAALADDDIVPIGYVPLLDDIFSQVRLTIAPLRYGAGLKGKVLDSLAAGVPCIMTTIAAEGLNLLDELKSLIVDDPQDFALLADALFRDERRYRRLAEAGQAYIGAHYAAAHIDQLIRDACEPNEPLQTEPTITTSPRLRLKTSLQTRTPVQPARANSRRRRGSAYSITSDVKER